MFPRHVAQWLSWGACHPVPCRGQEEAVVVETGLPGATLAGSALTSVLRSTWSLGLKQLW